MWRYSTMSLLESKNTSWVTVFLLKTFFTLKFDITSMLPFSWPAEPYVQMILKLNSFARFWRRAKECLFSYCVGALFEWIITSSSLIFYWRLRSCRTSSTNTGSCFVSSIKWKWNMVSPGQKIAQWSLCCFLENCADCASCFGRKARFSEKSSSIYFPKNLSLSIGKTILTWSTYDRCFK